MQLSQVSAVENSRQPNRLGARTRAALAIGIVALTSACGTADRIKSALSGSQPDQQWLSDSTTLASKPDVLFRILPRPDGAIAVPIALINSKGMREMHLGNRGWRAFDAAHLYAGDSLNGYRDGASIGAMKMIQGMWESLTPLDSLPGCPVLVPAGRITPSNGVRFATTKPRPVPKESGLLGESELQEAIRRVTTLIAPTVGVSIEQLARYRREVHQVPNKTSGASVVMIFDDPEQLPDTTSRVAQRARQVIVVVDKGIYGYRPTYMYSTVGVRTDLPRLKWVDSFDVDNDGAPEIFFTTIDTKYELYLVGLRYSADAWRDYYRSRRMRCDI